jgi:hypothetical protein
MKLKCLWLLAVLAVELLRQRTWAVVVALVAFDPQPLR